MSSEILTKGTKVTWTLDRINKMRHDKIEESLTLDYKRAAALDRGNQKNIIELSKDISAFANSAGGVLIYGVAEDSQNKYLPGELDPIQRSNVPKEWIESIFLNIQPRIDGILIHPVSINEKECLYVVEVPAGSTAHQAQDFRYYRRYNFSSVPMNDYEIRDVMNRLKHPCLTLFFELLRYTPENPMGMPSFSFGQEQKKEDGLLMKIFAKNLGSILANHIIAKVEVPSALIHPYELMRLDLIRARKDLPEFVTIKVDNQKQDRSLMGNAISDVRFEPLLPELDLYLGDAQLDLDTLLTSNQDVEVRWRVHVDNSPSKNGQILIGEIPVTDKRKR